MTSGNLKKLISSIQKNPVKYFATGVHQKYRYEKIIQSIKSSLMDVYDRFPSQSFGLLDGGASIIKTSIIQVSPITKEKLCIFQNQA